MYVYVPSGMSVICQSAINSSYLVAHMCDPGSTTANVRKLACPLEGTDVVRGHVHMRRPCYPLEGDAPPRSGATGLTHDVLGHSRALGEGFAFEPHVERY